MAKTKIFYTCQNCGFRSLKWLGKCPECSQWDTFVKDEEINEKSKKIADDDLNIKPILEHKIDLGYRICTNIPEWDNLLGKGLMKGSLNLLGGEPGIGKSTIMLQMADEYAKNNFKVLYVSGEESGSQIALRAKRLKINSKNIFLVSATEINAILNKIKKDNYHIIIFDSIQTLYNGELNSISGTISQIRDVAYKIFEYIKSRDISAFLIGHVTKSGEFAGPKVLEHIVDGVFYFEGDKHYNLRILRAIKNRFGSTNEIGVFEMKEVGLVPKRYDMFIDENQNSGMTLGIVKEGSRNIIIELQALVVTANYGVPQRVSSGFNHKRFAIILAVLDKYLNLNISKSDVFVNVAGGLKINDPFSDLALLAAIYSSKHDLRIDKKVIFVGEISLSGNIKTPSDIDNRTEEAKRFGISYVVLPEQKNKKAFDKKNNINYFFIDNIRDLPKIINNLE